MVLRRIFVYDIEEVIVSYKKSHEVELHNVSSSTIIRVIK